MIKMWKMKSEKKEGNISLLSAIAVVTVHQFIKKTQYIRATCGERLVRRLDDCIL